MLSFEIGSALLRVPRLFQEPPLLPGPGCWPQLPTQAFMATVLRDNTASQVSMPTPGFPVLALTGLGWDN